jgi:protein arginine N-methyltransferase 1
MTNLYRNMILQRIPDLKIHIDSSKRTRISVDGKVFEFGSYCLTVLDTFSYPISLSEALEKLQTRINGAQDWMDLMSTIAQLHEACVLQEESKIQPTLGTDPSGYYAAPIHVAMLNDRDRTSSLIDGIYNVIRPGDIVIDIGTGTGILAIAAARAGARHVYAIEASSIGKLAKAVFEANELADRITLIEGWSTQISLIELADVLVSDIIGSEPLSENVLEITNDAVKRLLKPDARLIPNRIKIFGQLVTIPRIELTEHTFTAEVIENWRSWYGIDFSPLAEVAKNSLHKSFIKPLEAINWTSLGEPVLLAEVDFKNIGQLVIDNTVTVTANISGPLDGLLEYFEIELSPTSSYSTNPKLVDKDCVRRNPIWVFTDPLILKVGDQFKITYQYRKTEDKSKVSIRRI